MIKVNLPLHKSFSNGNKIIFQRDTFDFANQDNIDFSRNYLYSIRGENGCGKTTFLNILSLLSNFDGSYYQKNGEIKVNASIQSIDTDQIMRKKFSYIFQDPHIINTYTIYENLRIVNPNFDLKRDINKITEQLQFSDNESKEYVVSKFKYLVEHLYDTPFYLSGGEKQLLAFIRAMIKPSSVIFADEPWANMDGVLKEFVENQLFLYTHNNDAFAHIRKTSSQNNMVLIITHTNHMQMNHDVCEIDDNWNESIQIIMKKNDEIVRTTNLNLQRYSHKAIH